MATKRGNDGDYSNPSPPKMATLDKYGRSGTPVKMAANYFELEKGPSFNLGQYRIDFEPDTEVTNTRKAIIRKNEGVLGLTRYTFDGASLYTATRLPEGTFNGQFDDKEMKITVRRTGNIQNNDEQAYQILNLIMRDAMAQLKLQNIRRNYYDPHAKKEIRDANLELWPGYLTSIRTYEQQDILVCVEIIHKFLRNETILDIAQNHIRNDRGRNDWQDLLRKEVVGTTVLTDYTNKTYTVDDIDFTKTPNSTFQPMRGEETTYMDYYRSKYGINIRDSRQFMLISRARERDIRAGQPENIYLVPELSRATGLTDSLRSNFKLMQQISNYTRLNPEDRVKALIKFNNRIQTTTESVNVLKQWNMSLSRQLVHFEARELPSETIIFGGDVKETASDRAEWTIKGRTTMYKTIDCTRWVFLYPRMMEKESFGFLDALKRAGQKMNYVITDPMHRAINDDRQESYIKEIETVAQKSPKMIVVALPTNRADRYSAIKRRCLVDFGIPMQVVVKRTMMHRSLDSVAAKIAIQINCKLGGIPWMIKLPIKGLMTLGFDVSHHPRDRSRSVGALCATMDLLKSSLFYSTTMEYKDGNEMVKNLDAHLSEALKTYHEICGALPDRIVLYRDGVGEGQIATVKAQEVDPIQKVLAHIYNKMGQSPRFAYIIVNKRVNSRFFKACSNTQYINPRPGTVIDKVVTMTDRSDFYLVSQNVGQGTVAPTYYNILTNTTGLTTDQLQILSFKMCHLYYNWSGTTRLPMVSQNAKKLAFLTSQSLQQPVHENLRKTLYFL